jgi:hypothetical protein
VAATVSLASAEPAERVPDIVAVNVLLLPDPQTIEHAQGLNRALRESYPAGFALDASHVPHISVLHAYVQSKHLPDVYQAVSKVMLQHPLVGEQLTVEGLQSKPWNGEQLTNIEIEKTAGLEAFQASLIAALAPFQVASGDQRAFVSSGARSSVDQETIEYVATFVQKHTGDRFEPHITVGISDAETARKIVAQPTSPAKVTIVSVAVFQLGNLGTARKQLWRQSH